MRRRSRRWRAWRTGPARVGRRRPDIHCVTVSRCTPRASATAPTVQPFALSLVMLSCIAVIDCICYHIPAAVGKSITLNKSCVKFKEVTPSKDLTIPVSDCILDKVHVNRQHVKWEELLRMNIR